MDGFVILLIAFAVIRWVFDQSSKKEKPGKRKQPGTPQKAQMPQRPVRKQAAHKPQPVQPKVPEYRPMTPEVLVPQTLQPTVLETELAEGSSMQDEDGCVGGSIAHDESVHQGRELHDEPHMHGFAAAETQSAQEPLAVQRPAVSSEQLRNAVIWAEILDRPVSMRE